jgi:putative transposase
LLAEAGGEDRSNRIVGYSIDSRMKSALAVSALNNAVARS